MTEQSGAGQRIRESSIEAWGWGSIGINILLSLLNLWISIASGSLAVTAEMVHNIIDLVASVTVLLGLIISQRRSSSFPYGLYKVENLVSVGIAGLIFFAGYEIVRDAILSTPHIPIVNAWIFIGVAFSAIIPLTYSFFELRAGKAASSPSLIASAQEYRIHIFSSGIVFLTLLGQIFHVHVDRWAAILVAFFIVRTGWDLIREGMRVLLDASLDAQTLKTVQQIIESDPAVARIKSLTGRNSGRYRFLETEILIRVNDLQKAHAASERIERAIREKVPHVERVIVHYEPNIQTLMRYALPLSASDGPISNHFGEAPYFLIVSIKLTDGQIEKQEIVVNPYYQGEKSKGIQVAEWLAGQKVDRVMLKQDLSGDGIKYVFFNSGIDIFLTEANTISEALTTIKSSVPASQKFDAGSREQDALAVGKDVN